MKVICRYCGEPVREVEPKNDTKIIKGTCDRCYCKHQSQEDLDKKIQESGDNPPDKK